MRYKGLCENVTNRRMAFYSLPTTVFGRRREIIRIENKVGDNWDA